MSHSIIDDPEAPIEITVINDEWNLESKKGFFTVGSGKSFPITHRTLINRNGARVELKGPNRPEPEYLSYRCQYIKEDVSFEFGITWHTMAPSGSPELLHNTSVHIFSPKIDPDSDLGLKFKTQLPQYRADIASAIQCGIIGEIWGKKDLGEIYFSFFGKNIRAL